ncbi:integrase-like protein [Natrinema pallidum DSM 3751]|uniref:Integrase-like protein n=1 Tax=Natrinema pallidum DSM 3751 TaxID=1227495 RepID=L9YTM6_9EURY|nr:integrase-like protein [Natrinema pallidum DSM 3751]
MTAHRPIDEDQTLVAERLSASGVILDKNYDRSRERQKSEQRRRFFELWPVPPG